MSTDIEVRLRDHYAKLADEVQIPEMSFDDLVAGSAEGVHRGRLDARQPRRRQLGRSWMLVAASVVIVVAGLAAMASRRQGAVTDDPPTAAESGERTPLSEVDDITPSEWVIATDTPADRQWLYPMVSATDVAQRVAWYGTKRFDGRSEQLSVSVGAPSANPEGEVVEISGSTWTVSAWTPGEWKATRQLATSTVTVSDRGVFDAADRDLIAGLVVVPESALPSPALGDPGRVVDVARYELDGVTHTFAVQESNGFWCTSVRSAGGSGSGCASTFDPAAPITIDGGSTSRSDGSDIVEVERAGTVSDDVARVEVEFGGAVISVVPVDESGLFDRKFWIVAARFDDAAEALLPPSASLLEVRAYDAQGRLIATQLPPSAGL